MKRDNNNVTYEQMKDFFERGEYRIEMAKEHHIGMEFNSFDKILETFFARKWVVLRASGSSGGFITCDHPLCLYWLIRRCEEASIHPGSA
jgi:hypothetical protein